MSDELDDACREAAIRAVRDHELGKLKGKIYKVAMKPVRRDHLVITQVAEAVAEVAGIIISECGNKFFRELILEKSIKVMREANADE
jgi:hypothetical protein